LAQALMAEEAPQLTALRERLWSKLQAVQGALLNGHPTRRLPGILNVSFPGVEGDSLLYACEGLAVSSGSACNSANQEPSYVLRALGRDDQLAGSSLRLSLGRFSTEAEVDAAAALVVEQYRRLKALAA